MKRLSHEKEKLREEQDGNTRRLYIYIYNTLARGFEKRDVRFAKQRKKEEGREVCRIEGREEKRGSGYGGGREERPR